MRAFLPLALLLLAGCLSGPLPGEGQEATPPETQVPAAPEPVDVDEVVNLLNGANGKEWSFEVAPGARDAEVLLVFRGADGAPVHGPLNACVRYRVENGNSLSTGSEGNCSGGGVSVSVGAGDLVQPETLFHWKGGEVPVGSVLLTLDAEPTLGEVAVTIRVHY